MQLINIHTLLWYLVIFTINNLIHYRLCTDVLFYLGAFAANIIYFCFYNNLHLEQLVVDVGKQDSSTMFFV